MQELSDAKLISEYKIVILLKIKLKNLEIY